MEIGTGEFEPCYQEFILIPCSGLALAGTQRNHIYKVVPRGQLSSENLGWMTEELAQQMLPDAKLSISGSHGLCPPCQEAWDRAI